jgi:hypothetical protein
MKITVVDTKNCRGEGGDTKLRGRRGQSAGLARVLQFRFRFFVVFSVCLGPLCPWALGL